MANAQVDKYNVQLEALSQYQNNIQANTALSISKNILPLDNMTSKYRLPNLKEIEQSASQLIADHNFIEQIINNAPKSANGKIKLYGMALSPEDAYTAISLDFHNYRETGYHLNPDQLLAGIRYVTKPGRYKQTGKFDDEPNIPPKGTIQQRLSRSKTTGGAFRVFLRAAIPMEKNLAKMYPNNSLYIRGNLANIAEQPAIGLITQRGQAPLTNAGRALMKHGNRPTSVFPSPRGNTQTMNQLGQEITEDILFDEASIFEEHLNKKPAFYKDIVKLIDIKSDYGKGVGIRFGVNKFGKIEFIGYLEP